jgi:hypothetical protein
MKKVEIENTTVSELIKLLGDAYGGRMINVNDIPYVELNIGQAADFLKISRHTLLKLMEQGEVSNVGTGAALRFGLPELFLVWVEFQKTNS